MVKEKKMVFSLKSFKAFQVWIAGFVNQKIMSQRLKKKKRKIYFLTLLLLKILLIYIDLFR